MRIFSYLALSVAAIGLGSNDPRASAQDAKGPAPKPLTLYAQFRELVNEGKFDIAANFLAKFLESNPSDADLLEIEKKYGTTAFTTLRNIPRWSENPAADQKARQDVEEAIKRAREATARLLYTPERVNKYIRNLGATYEERVFAELELRRTGDYAIPFLVEQFRTTRDTDLVAGIVGAIGKLEGHTMAGWIAALDGMTPEQQFAVITAISQRPDLVALQSEAQTDLTPYLWRIVSRPPESPEGNPTLRALAEGLLNKLRPGSKVASRIPEAELVAIARTFYDRTARFGSVKNNPDGTSTVPVWVWESQEPTGAKLVKLEDVPLSRAEEYYGLRYARWALERRPDYEPAQSLILSLAAERAITRSRFGPLAESEPAVHRLLSDAPSSVLGDMLGRGLNQKKTALAVAALQVLADRGDKNTITGLVKALDYPDPQVQFLAATGLLRSPVPVPPQVRGKVVEVLRRAAATDPLAPGDAKGTALIADPNKSRADALASLLRGLGYQVEIFITGRDLLRRVSRSSDFDLLFIDHHTPNPELIDLIGQLQADTQTGGRPTFVIASSDKTPVPTFDQLLVRFAALIAATENDRVPMPPPYVPDTRLSDEVNQRERVANQRERDNQFAKAMTRRLARLRRVVESTGIDFSPVQKTLFELRLELITYAALAAEFPLSPESAPATARRVREVRDQIDRQPPSPPYGTGTPTLDLLKLIERFEADLARVPSARRRFEEIYAKIDPVKLGLPVETFRNPAAELQLARTLRGYPAVKIIPEPFARVSLQAELDALQADPSQAPRDPALKKAAQRVAIDWLRKMATNELPGFEVQSAEPELRNALRYDDLAEAAIDALLRFGTGDVQQALLNAATSTTPQRPLPVRLKAADATIRHVQMYGKYVGQSYLDQLAEAADREADLTLRGKLNILRGLLVKNPEAIPDPQTGKPVPNPASFTNQLKSYNPPLLPPPPAKEPPKEPDAEPKKDH